ncbi:MAG: ATP-binding protein [Cocleimonas sp.]
MTRLFLSLLAVLLLALLGYGFLIGNTITYFAKGIIGETRMGQVGGIAKLLDDELIGLNQQQRKARLSRLQSFFKLKIDLLPLNDIPDTVLSPADKRDLLKKGVTVNLKGEGETNFFLSKVDNLVWEIQVALDSKDQDKLFMEGPLALINQQLSSIPQKDWQQKIKRVSGYFDEPPLQLLPLSTLTSDTLLNEQDIQQLQANKSVLIFKNDSDLTHIYNRINQSEQVLKIGPVSYPAVLNNIQVFAFIFLSMLLSTAIWLWLRPVWRDLNTLKLASKAFGEGQLSTRITLPKYSLINSSLKSFNGMAEHIEQLISSHKTLTNAVSHELRTPVSRLRFGLEMLTKTKNDDDKVRYIASMNTDIEELDTMLAELLTYARMDRQEIALNKKPVVLSEWLEEQAQYWQSQCMHIKIENSHTGLSLNNVTCMDQKLMTRALHNLIQNACRYAKNKIYLHLGFDPNKNQLTLSVEDDGIGVPAQYHTTLFDPFTRVDDSRGRDSGGYGLGLAIVKQIIKAHQGEATITQSSLGGAKFVLEWECNH